MTIISLSQLEGTHLGNIEDTDGIVVKHRLGPHLNLQVAVEDWL